MEKKGIDRNAIFLWTIVGCFFIILGLAKNNIKIQYDLDVLTHSFERMIPNSSLIIADHIKQGSYDTSWLQEAVNDLCYSTDHLTLIEDDEATHLQCQIASKLKNFYLNDQLQLLSEKERVYISDFMGHDFFRTADVQQLDEFSMYLTSIIQSILERSQAEG